MATQGDKIKQLEKDVATLKESNRVQNEILGHLAEVAKGQVESYPQIMSLLQVASDTNDKVGEADEDETAEEATE